MIVYPCLLLVFFVYCFILAHPLNPILLNVFQGAKSLGSHSRFIFSSSFILERRESEPDAPEPSLAPPLRRRSRLDHIPWHPRRWASSVVGRISRRKEERPLLPSDPHLVSARWLVGFRRSRQFGTTQSAPFY